MGYPKGETPITCRPGDVIEPGLAKVQVEVKDLAKNLDDELIVALYPITGKKFLRIKYGLEPMPEEMKAKTIEELEKAKTPKPEAPENQRE